MKKITLLSTIILGATIFGATTQANAEEVSVKDQTGSTPTTVTVKDADDKGKDPLDPKDPNQTHLTLESVPAEYNFETAVSNKSYTLESSLTQDNNIVVFNDRTSRNWSVKAAVTDNVIKRTNGDSFVVDSFTVNGDEIATTGATGVVAKAKITGDTEQDKQGNTGNISNLVNKISIKFGDLNNTIKTGDELKGSVTYQLYATMDAQ